VRGLRAFLWKRLVVKLTSRYRVERQIDWSSQRNWLGCARSLGLAAFRSAKPFSPLPKRLEPKRTNLLDG
jgi:hypothetical protein